MPTVKPFLWSDSIYRIDLLIQRQVNHFFVKKKSLQKLLDLKGGVDLVQSWHMIITITTD